MSLTNASETAILSLIFENANWAGIGDATGLRGSSTAGSFYISLHTADPTETGDQESSEAAYTSYARVAIARSLAAWNVAADNCSNAAAITFPAATGGSATCTYVGVGTDASGGGTLVASGALTAPLAVTSGITPEFAIDELDITAA